MNLFIRNSKRLYLINRSFQLRLGRAAVCIGILSTVLTGTIILYPLYIFEILRIPRFLPWPILISMGLASVINVASIFYLAILASHRIAGPMFNLHRSMRRISSGQFNSTIKFRKTDELQYISRAFNEMSESLCLLTERDLNTLNEALNLLKLESIPPQNVQNSVVILETLRNGTNRRIFQENP